MIGMWRRYRINTGFHWCPLKVLQNEDDLRGLAKVVDFMRALSVILMLIHCYWFCYAALSEQGWTVRLMDKVLLNFNRNTGLFNHLVYTKLFAVVFLALSCLGTKGVLNEKVESYICEMMSVCCVGLGTWTFCFTQFIPKREKPIRTRGCNQKNPRKK
jgi:hypothetical protein